VIPVISTARVLSVMTKKTTSAPVQAPQRATQIGHLGVISDAPPAS
jgi:hypothetical protein